jgi:hypothetical protein
MFHAIQGTATACQLPHRKMVMKHTVQEVWDEVQLIKLNHLEHLRQDVEHVKSDLDKLDKKVDKMDSKLWWLLCILVTTVVLPVVVNFLK